MAAELGQGDSVKMKITNACKCMTVPWIQNSACLASVIVLH